MSGILFKSDESLSNFVNSKAGYSDKCFSTVIYVISCLNIVMFKTHLVLFILNLVPCK